MRDGRIYFGLLAPRSITPTLAAVFMLLGQKRRPKLGRLDWASLRLKCFGKDPLVDDRGRTDASGRSTEPAGGIKFPCFRQIHLSCQTCKGDAFSSSFLIVSFAI